MSIALAHLHVRKVTNKGAAAPTGPACTFSGNADSFSHLATRRDSNGPNCVRLTSWVTANTPSAPFSRRLISRLEGRDDLEMEQSKRVSAPSAHWPGCHPHQGQRIRTIEKVAPAGPRAGDGGALT